MADGGDVSRRLTVGVLCSLLILGSPGAASADSSASGGSDGQGTIDAGVHHYFGRWNGRRSSCVWDLMSGTATGGATNPGSFMRWFVGGVEYRLFLKACPGAPMALVWVGPGSGRRLAGESRDALVARLPAPRAGFAPPASQTYTTLETWFWTTTAWDPVSITAWVPTEGNGTVWATTTATPLRLRLDPGDGSDEVVCPGPGEAWTEAAGDDGHSECAHVFEHSSLLADDGETYRGTLSIDWAIEWISNTGEGGPLAGAATSVPVRFSVGEIQAVVES
jgi:hypothetical protein